jgi:hypothetical protein
MTECKPVSTPLPVNLDLSLKDSPEVVDPKLQAEYRAIVGSLMHLNQWTRPDLGFAVTFLSRYLHRPGIKHFLLLDRHQTSTLSKGSPHPRDEARIQNDSKSEACAFMTDKFCQNLSHLYFKVCDVFDVSGKRSPTGEAKDFNNLCLPKLKTQSTHRKQQMKQI